MDRLALALAGLVCVAVAAPAAGRPHFIDARLVAETLAPRPGQKLLVGVQMIPQPGWHGYWSNPGESGLAPVVQWKAPAGVRFGPLQHPAPTLMRVMGMTSYVHAGPHMLISRMTVDPGLKAGTSLPISADVNWAACSDRLCVPEHATLWLQMIVGDGAPSDAAPLVHRAAAAEPGDGGEGRFDLTGGSLLLQLPAHAHVDPSRARFFPDENGLLNAAEEHARASLPPRIEAPAKGPLPTRITGVVSDGSAAYRVSFRRGLLSRGPQASVETLPGRAAGTRRPPSVPAAQAAAAPVHSAPQSPRTIGSWTRIAVAGLTLAGLAGLILLVRRKRAMRGELTLN